MTCFEPTLQVWSHGFCLTVRQHRAYQRPKTAARYRYWTRIPNGKAAFYWSIRHNGKTLDRFLTKSRAIRYARKAGIGLLRAELQKTSDKNS